VTSAMAPIPAKTRYVLPAQHHEIVSVYQTTDQPAGHVGTEPLRVGLTDTQLILNCRKNQADLQSVNMTVNHLCFPYWTSTLHDLDYDTS